MFFYPDRISILSQFYSDFEIGKQVWIVVWVSKWTELQKYTTANFGLHCATFLERIGCIKQFICFYLYIQFTRLKNVMRRPFTNALLSTKICNINSWSILKFYQILYFIWYPTNPCCRQPFLREKLAFVSFFFAVWNSVYCCT